MRAATRSSTRTSDVPGRGSRHRQQAAREPAEQPVVRSGGVRGGARAALPLAGRSVVTACDDLAGPTYNFCTAPFGLEDAGHYPKFGQSQSRSERDTGDIYDIDTLSATEAPCWLVCKSVITKAKSAPASGLGRAWSCEPPLARREKDSG